MNDVRGFKAIELEPSGKAIKKLPSLKRVEEVHA